MESRLSNKSSPKVTSSSPSLANLWEQTNSQYIRDYLISRSSCRSIVGAVLSTSGIILLLLKAWIWELVGTPLFTLKPNSLITSCWQKTDPVPTDVYVFNWTNSQDFSNLSIKPKFEELGPFKYNVVTEKTNLTWNDNNTVTFYNKRTLYFDKDLDIKSLHEKIVTLDVINVFSSHRIRYWNYYIKKIYSSIMSSYSRKVDISTTVDQLLHNGFDDFVMSIYNYVPFIVTDIPRFDRFGFLHIRNASDTFEGLMNMETGVNGKFDIRNWNYANTTRYYNGSCSKVRGSLGELHSRPLRKDRTEVFLPDICRSVSLDFDGEVFVDGIEGYRYSLRESALDNGSCIPENVCTCAGDCIPSGLINVSSCRYGLPVYYSLPHFNGADPVYLNDIEGMKPDKEKHVIYLIIEPHTSVPLKVQLAMQVNVYVHPVDDIGPFENVRKSFFPILWVHQETVLPENITRLLKIYLKLPHIIVGVGVILICLGLCLQFSLTCTARSLFRYKRIRKPIPAMILSHEQVLLQATECEKNESSVEMNVYK